MKLVLATLAVGCIFALPAAASQQGAIALKNWHKMDSCAREAQTAFPDFTADSNAKRDAKLKECLEGKNLPPRELPIPGR
ncbi:MAG: hypothetical protein ACM3JG_02710 [Thiohalocapsa sp.]